MRPTTILLQQALRLTFFTRPNCSLCVEAKEVVHAVGQRRRFEFNEVDVLEKGQRQWKKLYQFDTPVLHVDATEESVDGAFETTPTALKLMHRFTEQQLEETMDAALASSKQQ